MGEENGRGHVPVGPLPVGSRDRVLGGGDGGDGEGEPGAAEHPPRLGDLALVAGRLADEAHARLDAGGLQVAQPLDRGAAHQRLRELDLEAEGADLAPLAVDVGGLPGGGGRGAELVGLRPDRPRRAGREITGQKGDPGVMLRETAAEVGEPGVVSVQCSLASTKVAETT